MPSPDPQLPEVPPYVFLLLAFTVWMLVDAYRRRAPLHWFILIFLFSPFGAIVYFFVVKLKDMRSPSPNPQADATPRSLPFSLFSGRLGTDELGQADEFERQEQYRMAEPLYRSVLLQRKDDKRALHGLARCRHAEGDYREAIELFETLLSLEREYANFGAALDFADTLWSAGRRADALELLETLANFTHRINHRLAHAHYLSLSGDVRRARTEIGRALTEYQALTPDLRRRHQVWVDRANTMLAELDQGVETPNPE
jgi:hypothetical protein